LEGNYGNLNRKGGVEIHTRTNSYEDISADVILNVTRTKEQDGDYIREVVVKEKKVKTDSSGNAVFEFPVKSVGAYRVVATVFDSKGRKAYREWSCYVNPDRSGKL
jgi:hypothetical protein